MLNNNKKVEVELANCSMTWWVSIDDVDYTAISEHDENTNYDNFTVYRVDDKEVTKEEIEAVKEAIETQGK